MVKDFIEVMVLFNTLILQLLHGKYHICCSSLFPQSALAIQYCIIYEIFIYAIKQDACEDLASYAKEANSAMVITASSVSLIFV
jgi:hypothetical protein